MTQLKSLHARHILDSRGNPTLEVDAILEDGSMGRTSVPSGASTGQHEAVELRDGDPDFYGGKGVNKAIQNVNTEIKNALKGQDVLDQSVVDQILIDLDGTENKGRLGANAILGASLAIAKAVAASKKMPFYGYLKELYQTHDREDRPFSLPMPLMNLVNGGAHSDAPIDIQEFMIVPLGATTFSSALQMGTEIFHALKKRLKQAGLSTAVGDEGGFAPHLGSSNQVLDHMMAAGKSAGFEPGVDFAFALDAAATEFFDSVSGQYIFKGAGLTLTSTALVDYYVDLHKKYPLVSIEDGMAEDDFSGWQALTKAFVHKNVQIVGDDLFVTNKKRLETGIKDQQATSILIKLNQIGTLTETLETIALAHKSVFTCVISHRSGETEDTTIADLSVAVASGQIKTGSLSRTDRLSKYNQLLRIEEELTTKNGISKESLFKSPF